MPSRLPNTPCASCKNPIPIAIRVDGRRIGLRKRRYCLDCSPLGAHNTRRLDGQANKSCSRYRARRDSLIGDVKAAYLEGESEKSIAKRLKACHATIRKWLLEEGIVLRSHAEAMKVASERGTLKGSKDWTEESRAKQRANMLRRIAEDPMNHPNRKLAGNRSKMSFPERLTFDSLTAAKIDFKHGIRVGIYYPDFIVGTRIFEVDGERWHDPVADAKRDAVLREMGYTVERFPAKAVLKNPDIILHRLQVL